MEKTRIPIAVALLAIGVEGLKLAYPESSAVGIVLAIAGLLGGAVLLHPLTKTSQPETKIHLPESCQPAPKRNHVPLSIGLALVLILAIGLRKVGKTPAANRSVATSSSTPPTQTPIDDAIATPAMNGRPKPSADPRSRRSRTKVHLDAATVNDPAEPRSRSLQKMPRGSAPSVNQLSFGANSPNIVGNGNIVNSTVTIASYNPPGSPRRSLQEFGRSVAVFLSQNQSRADHDATMKALGAFRTAHANELVEVNKVIDRYGLRDQMGRFCDTYDNPDALEMCTQKLGQFSNLVPDSPESPESTVGK